MIQICSRNLWHSGRGVGSSNFQLERVARGGRSWMYLQPIFESEDIMKQLPAEAKRFKTIDQTWRKTMEEVRALRALVVSLESIGFMWPFL